MSTQRSVPILVLDCCICTVLDEEELCHSSRSTQLFCNTKYNCVTILDRDHKVDMWFD